MDPVPHPGRAMGAVRAAAWHLADNGGVTSGRIIPRQPAQ